ncbi:hypothetical protein ACJIZ3_013867 [Penstemon smallii]|uniref:N-acetyltransferase domain-containing protein n=1 Tax=Penstemon smallii TaxID=265156 RepID=A0ABD3RI15_9LAMI
MDEISTQSGGKEEMFQENLNITLRPIALSDVDKVSKFCLWDTYTSKEQALNYIKDHAISHPWHRVICIENRAIGTISVTPFYHGSDVCRGELGYVLAHKYWGKGIVTKAVKMVVDSVFKEWPKLKRLQALVHVGNKGSQRVLEKAGFEKEGVLRNYIVMKGEIVDSIMFSVLVE